MGRPTDAKHRKPAKVPAAQDKAAQAAVKTVKSKRRRKRSKVDAEIRRLRKDHGKKHIPKSAFKRLLSDILGEMAPGMKMSAKAVSALQEAAEMEMTSAFSTANFLAKDVANQAGILPKDFQAAVHLSHPLLKPLK